MLLLFFLNYSHCWPKEFYCEHHGIMSNLIDWNNLFKRSEILVNTPFLDEAERKCIICFRIVVDMSNCSILE